MVGAVGDATQGRQVQLALGETPNLAARLQALAQPNTILISDTTKRLAGGTFRYVDLGLQSVKGATQPLQTWQVLQANDADRFTAATQAAVTPLVGRTQELGLLLERWQLAQEGDGQVVLLSGQPGIGKSRVMNTLRERLGDAVSFTLRFQCSPYHTNSAYYPLIAQLARTWWEPRGKYVHQTRTPRCTGDHAWRFDSAACSGAGGLARDPRR